MIVPFILLILSGLAAGISLLQDKPDWLALAVLCATASLVLIVQAALRPRDRARNDRFNRRDLDRNYSGAPQRLPRKGRRKAPEKLVVVDGSNVLYWKDNTPQIETLQEVLRLLEARGYTPGVVFDANAGYLIAGKYKHDYAFGKLLRLPHDRVLVVAKGQPADPIILAAAQDQAARVVSNDRYRDWAKDHPEVAEPAHFLRGGYRDGALWLDT
jgi:hypothetical protein